MDEVAIAVHGSQSYAIAPIGSAQAEQVEIVAGIGGKGGETQGLIRRLLEDQFVAGLGCTEGVEIDFEVVVLVFRGNRTWLG